MLKAIVGSAILASSGGVFVMAQQSHARLQPMGQVLRHESLADGAGHDGPGYSGMRPSIPAANPIINVRRLLAK